MDTKWSPVKPPQDGEFYTLNKEGEVVLRNLAEEHKTFNVPDYDAGLFDSYNFLYYENFEFHGFNSRGSDYERFGCMIKEGMKVLDLGANIGSFARYAKMRGAQKVYCFEPLTPTYYCLMLNTLGDDVIEPYKLAVSDTTGKTTFRIHTDMTHNGGGSMIDFVNKSLDMHHSESCATIGIAEIFKNENWGDVDFLKIDIEGAEEVVLKALPDAALKRLVCISGEFHSHSPVFDQFQEDFIKRCSTFGFESYTLYHGDGKLRTLTLWKN